MQLRRIDYKHLKSKQKEIYNFQKVAGLLADYGFNCIKLADDWQGADFLAYHKDGFETLKVQLKSRITIHKKYLGKDIFIAFPYRNDWYLIEHDALVKIIQQLAFKSSKSPSWISKGYYHFPSPSVQLMVGLAEYKL